VGGCWRRWGCGGRLGVIFLPSHFPIAFLLFVAAKREPYRKSGREIGSKKGAHFRPPQRTRSLDLIDNSEMDQKFEIRGACKCHPQTHRS
jgi:hypothetical protein